MPTRKRRNKRNLNEQERMNNAEKWLTSRERPCSDYVEKYSKRYGVESEIARAELIAIGYWEDVFTEEMHKQGKEVEYLVNPLTGDLVLVEAGTEEHELFV